jgi:Domain of unknown function (DUF3846)
MIQVVVKEPGENPVRKLIDGTVESIQKEVGGYFEVHRLAPGLTVYANEDGKRKYLAPNINDTCHPAILVGTLLVMRGDNGLEDADVPKVTYMLLQRAVMA